MTALTILDSVPEGLVETSARDLHTVLSSPSLLDLPGERGTPLFVSGLLHGNEDAGLGAIQTLLRTYRGHPFPRPLLLFLGNVAAARDGLRRLDGQPDYNRVWPGCSTDQATPEALAMAEVHHLVIAREAFAAIDIHNNTGRNPHYGVVCVDDPQVLGLAALFAQRAVLFRGLPGTQTASFSGHIPALTIECGQPGSAENAAAAARFIDRVLTLDTLPTDPGARGNLALFHTLAQVKLKPEVALREADEARWLALAPNLDRLNFETVARGTTIGRTNDPMPLAAIDEAGADIAAQVFTTNGGALTLARDAIPAMLTDDERVIRQDCLCYLMEQLAPDD